MGVPLLRTVFARRDAPAPVIDHHRFGIIRATLSPGGDSFIWQCLDLVPTSRGPADLEFTANAFGPTAAHERQLEAVLRRLDSLVLAARAEVETLMPECLRLKCTHDSSAQFELQGAHLTAKDGLFQLHFWCECEAAMLVTVEFDQWQPTSAHLHD